MSETRAPTPTFALTLGDPCGIGPEIVAALAASPPPGARLLVIGATNALERGGLVLPEVAAPSALSDAQPIGRLASSEPLRGLAPWGSIDAEAGRASHAWVLQAAELAKRGAVAGMVTAPIHKQAWHRAGVRHPGHTEVLAEIAGIQEALMCFVAGPLRVALTTIHLPLARVPDAVTEARVLHALRILGSSVPPAPTREVPRLVVCGLNPHAGEGGLLGAEDGEVLEPAVQTARAEGLDVVGPLPADAALPAAAAGRYDAALAMYHDQGLPVVKALAPRQSVNTTLGLGFIRTSVDHGTAFDIAGRGVADAAGLRAAVEEAIRQAANLGKSPSGA